MSETETYYKASSWDPLLRIITVGINIFAVVLIYYNPKLITILIMGGLVLIPPFFMIKGYSLTDQKLIIHRLGWTTTFDISDMVRAEYDPQAIKGSWRLLGNGGLYGWIGSFSNKKLGTFRAYATNRNKCVALELEGQTLLVTPDTPGSFVEKIQTHIQH